MYLWLRFYFVYVLKMDKRTHNNIFYKVYEKDEIERGIEKNVVADEKKEPA